MSRADLTDRYSAFIFAGCKPVMDYGDRTKHKTDAQGNCVYEVSCLAIPAPLFGEEQEPETDFAVHVAAPENPCKGFEPGTSITFERLYLDYGKYNGKYWKHSASSVTKA